MQLACRVCLYRLFCVFVSAKRAFLVRPSMLTHTFNAYLTFDVSTTVVLSRDLQVLAIGPTYIAVRGSAAVIFSEEVPYRHSCPDISLGILHCSGILPRLALQSPGWYL